MAEENRAEVEYVNPPIRNANPWTRVRVAKHFTEPSLAKQSFKNECDINNIMRKFEKDGLMDHLNTHKGEYGDFIGYQDYQTSINRVLEAQEAFLTIPAKVRYQFKNNPAEFLEFAQNPENFDQMVEMGLATPKRTEPHEGERHVKTSQSADKEPEAPTKAPEAEKPPLYKIRPRQSAGTGTLLDVNCAE